MATHTLIKEIKKHRFCFVVGGEGAGKSSLLYELVARYINHTGEKVALHCAPGKTEQGLSADLLRQLRQERPDHIVSATEAHTLSVMDDSCCETAAKQVSSMFQPDPGVHYWFTATHLSKTPAALFEACRVQQASPCFMLLPGAEIEQVLQHYPQHRVAIQGMRLAQQQQPDRFIDIILIDQQYVRFQRVYMDSYSMKQRLGQCG